MPTASQLAEAMLTLGTATLTVKIFNANGDKLLETQAGSSSTVSELKSACEVAGFSICDDRRALKEFVKDDLAAIKNMCIPRASHPASSRPE